MTQPAALWRGLTDSAGAAGLATGSPTPNRQREHDRLLTAYRSRMAKATEQSRFFSYDSPAHVMRIHERHRETLNLLIRHGFHPLRHFKILDVGSGNGNMIRQFLQWGALPERVAEVEDRPEGVALARRLNPNLDIHCGSASELPWPSESFDLVCQHTMFSCILDQETRRAAANEMIRVLRPAGAILWYDFTYNNPRNPDVSGVTRAEIVRLFPGFTLDLRRITLAPVVARRLPPSSLDLLYPALARIPLLRTHDLGLLKRPAADS